MRDAHYTARCERDETGWWVVTVAKLPGVVTQARSLVHARDRTREAIALWLDVAKSAVAVELDIVGAEDARSEWADGRRDLQRGTELREAGSAKTRDAVRKLLAQGLSVRDTAVVLDVSPARVQQLAASRATANKVAAKRSSTKATAKKSTKKAAKVAA